MPGADLDQVAAADQPFERGLDPVALFAFGAELADKLLEGRPCVRQAGDVVEKSGWAHATVMVAAEMLASVPVVEHSWAGKPHKTMVCPTKQRSHNQNRGPNRCGRVVCAPRRRLPIGRRLPT